MSVHRFTVLDGIVTLAAGGIVAVVIFRFRVQQHFDLYGLLVMTTMVAGYLSYRRSPVRKEDGRLNDESTIPDEKQG